MQPQRSAPLVLLLSLPLLTPPGQARCAELDLALEVHATGARPLSAAAGDVDGDGIADLVASDPADGSLVLRPGLPAGGYGPGLTLASGAALRGLVLEDLDGDGDLDVATCDEGTVGSGGWQGQSLIVLRNDGSGDLSDATLVQLAGELLRPWDLAAGDLDGDGVLDLAVAALGSGSQASRVATLRGLGGASFAPPVAAACGWGPVSLRLGDLDGDGVLDAITANQLADTITILRGVGDGTLVPAWGHSAGIEPSDVALADHDGDGALDAAVSYRNGVLVLRNVGGTLDFLASLSAGLLPSGVDLGDLDGDGDADLVATDSIGGQLRVWTGDGSGAFVLEGAWPTGSHPARPRIADVEGDLDRDCIVPVEGGLALLVNTCPVATYCTGKTNSAGCVPAIEAGGSPSLSGPDDFHLIARQEVPGQPGIAFLGRAPASVPFAGGTLCVAPPLARTSVQVAQGAGGSCAGVYDLHVTAAWLVAHGFLAGEDLHAQYWSRDPLAPDGTGIALSNALRFTVLP